METRGLWANYDDQRIEAQRKELSPWTQGVLAEAMQALAEYQEEHGKPTIEELCEGWEWLWEEDE